MEHSHPLEIKCGPISEFRGGDVVVSVKDKMQTFGTLDRIEMNASLLRFTLRNWHTEQNGLPTAPPNPEPKEFKFSVTNASSEMLDRELLIYLTPQFSSSQILFCPPSG
jgi:hypothetical protein